MIPENAVKYHWNELIWFAGCMLLAATPLLRIPSMVKPEPQTPIRTPAEIFPSAMAAILPFAAIVTLALILVFSIYPLVCLVREIPSMRIGPALFKSALREILYIVLSTGIPLCLLFLYGNIDGLKRKLDLGLNAVIIGSVLMALIYPVSLLWRRIVG